MGYALKKIIKWALINLGVLLGIVFLAIQYLANNGYITGKILWDKMGNDLFLMGQQAVHQLDANSIHGLFHTLAIPVTSGLGIGLVAGFVKAH
jgi:uncharacterized membrane protein (Fun14 family)